MNLAELRALGFDLSRHVPFTREYRVKCGECEALVINGYPTHEQGCPKVTMPIRTKPPKLCHVCAQTARLGQAHVIIVHCHACDTDTCPHMKCGCEATVEAPSTMPCPECGGTGEALGALGRLMHYRCRHCGWTFSDGDL